MRNGRKGKCRCIQREHEGKNALDGQREKKTESQKQEKYKKKKARVKTK